MYDLQGASFLDGSICGGTIRTVNCFTGSAIDSFEDGLSLDIFEIGTAETFDENATVGFFE